MRLVVLGAGASHGASHYASVRPPLVEHFFAAAAVHGLLSENFAERELRALRADIDHHGGDWRRAAETTGEHWQGHLAGLKAFIEEQLAVREAQLASTPINIERLFGLIEAALLGRVGYDQLRGVAPARTYADVLEQQLYLIICGALIASTRDVRCEHHAQLARWLRPGDVVLSFNYDLLMDRALADRGDWWINDGYAMNFHRVGKWSGQDGEWRVPLPTQSRIILLKPHGSLNWLCCRDPRETNLHVSLRGGTAKPAANALYCLQDMHDDFESDWPLFEWWARYEHDDEEGYSFDLHSLIIPPAITKQYRDYEGHIGHVWAHAVSIALHKAEEIYFIGYSLRPEDLRSWWLFRTAAAQADKLRRVAVVDPSNAVRERIASVFDRHGVDYPADDIAAFAQML